MNNIQIFNSPEFGEIRTIERDGEPWFVAADVCAVFGETNRNRAMQALDDDEKGYTQMNTPGGNQKVSVVNESGLYSLLFAMQPTKARGVSAEHIEQRQAQLKKFKRWVTSEVIPSIRKHGAYIAGQGTMTDAELMAQAVLAANRMIEERNNRIYELEQEKAELVDDAAYTRNILNNPGLVNANQIAKDYGMSARSFNQLLNGLGVQYKQGEQWLLYSKHQGKGYTHSETEPYKHKDGSPDVKMRTKWTQRGRLFLYNLLKEHGIVPEIERTDLFDRQV